VQDLGEIRARASRDALEVINMARDPARKSPVLKIATNHPGGLIVGETAFDAAWGCSNGDWPAKVWDAYRDTFQVECGKANIGLIHSEARNATDDGGIVASIHTVDLERWRLKDGQRIQPGVIADGVHTERLPDLFKSTRRTLRERLGGLRGVAT